MCGRFTLRAPALILAEVFGIPPLPGLRPRYNIAPTQPIAVVRGAEQRVWCELRWGLIPYWAKEASIGNRMVNARAETVADKPAYREPFARRRCLIPADGFYEWQKLGRARKQPYYLHRADDRPFAFAGIWDRWRDRRAGGWIDSCALITTEPNDLVAPIHDRMPVILQPGEFDRWLDPGSGVESLRALLRPTPVGNLVARPVTVHVNNAANDDSACIEPLVAERSPRALFD